MIGFCCACDVAVEHSPSYLPCVLLSASYQRLLPFPDVHRVLARQSLVPTIRIAPLALCHAWYLSRTVVAFLPQVYQVRLALVTANLHPNKKHLLLYRSVEFLNRPRLGTMLDAVPGSALKLSRLTQVIPVLPKNSTARCSYCNCVPGPRVS